MEYSILNFGTFLGIFGLIFAGYQLLDGIHKLRLEFRNTKRFILLAVLACTISSLIGAILPFIPGHALPLLGYSIFREFLTITGVLILGVKFYFNLTNPIRLKHDSDNQRFLNLTMNYLATDQKKLNAYANEMKYFFKDFQEGTISNDVLKEAFTHIISINLVEEIIVNQPGTLESIIRQYSENYSILHYNDEDGLLREFFDMVFYHSLLNNNSFIARELNGEMHQHYKNGIFLRYLISDFEVVHELGLLSSNGSKLNLFVDKNNTFYSNFIKLWRRSIETFFDQDQKRREVFLRNFNSYHKSLYYGLVNISGAIKQSLDELSVDISVKGLSSSFGYSLKSFQDEVSEVYGDDYPSIDYNTDKYTIVNPGERDIRNFFDSIVFGLLECYEAYSFVGLREQYKDGKSLMRDYVWSLQDFLSLENDKYDVEVMRQLQLRLQTLLKCKISRNLKGYYPMYSRIFRFHYGYQIFTHEGTKPTGFIWDVLKMYAERLPEISEGLIYNYTAEDLEKEYTKEYVEKKSSKVLEGLLPPNMEYDHGGDELRYFFRDRSSWVAIDLKKYLDSGELSVRSS